MTFGVYGPQCAVDGLWGYTQSVDIPVIPAQSLTQICLLVFLGKVI